MIDLGLMADMGKKMNERLVQMKKKTYICTRSVE